MLNQHLPDTKHQIIESKLPADLHKGVELKLRSKVCRPVSQHCPDPQKVDNHGEKFLPRVCCFVRKSIFGDNNLSSSLALLCHIKNYSNSQNLHLIEDSPGSCWTCQRPHCQRSRPSRTAQCPRPGGRWCTSHSLGLHNLLGTWMASVQERVVFFPARFYFVLLWKVFHPTCQESWQDTRGKPDLMRWQKFRSLLLPLTCFWQKQCALSVKFWSQTVAIVQSRGKPNTSNLMQICLFLCKCSQKARTLRPLTESDPDCAHLCPLLLTTNHRHAAARNIALTDAQGNPEQQWRDADFTWLLVFSSAHTCVHNI